jgi:hypothetical protein
MKIFARFLTAAILLAGLSQVAAAQTAEEIVDKYLKALGGPATLAKLQSRHVVGTLSLTAANGMVISGTAEVFSQAPNKQRTMMTADLSQMGMGKITVDQRFDGNSGFVMDPMQGNREITGGILDNMKNSAFPTPFLNYKERGATIEYIRKDPVGSGEAFVVLLKPKAGSSMMCFFDTQSFLLVKTVTTVNVPQLGGDVEQINELFDYRDQDGTKVPFQMKSTSSVQSVTIDVTKVEHNIAMDPAMFSKPAGR